MKIYYETRLGKLYHGDCLEIMRELEDNSVDAVVTDPPYGLSFMGKKWDYDVPSQEIWQECLRVLKPGGYLLAFSGTRTQHRMAVRIEDAGFEIRDMIAWVYGSGFPKSHNIGKAVDKLQGNEREYLGFDKSKWRDAGNHKGETIGKDFNYYETKCTITKGTSEWEGWGTALKPSLEPITVARKPISEKSVAENCLRWGTGGINIDGCRVETADNITNHSSGSVAAKSKGKYGDSKAQETHQTDGQSLGRFPANLIHDGSDEVVGLFPDTGKSTGGRIGNKGSMINTMGNNYKAGDPGFGDSGSAARYFKVCNDSVSVEAGCVPGQKQTNVTLDGTTAQPRLYYTAKASKAERNAGCEELEATRRADRNLDNGIGGDNPRNRTNIPKKNHHPTVKPVALMEYLVTLVSRDGAIILDPFFGSGTTGVACELMGRRWIGIELDEEYCEIAAKRIEEAAKENPLFESIAK
jgi:DNA modification methylase